MSNQNPSGGSMGNVPPNNPKPKPGAFGAAYTYPVPNFMQAAQQPQQLQAQAQASQMNRMQMAHQQQMMQRPPPSTFMQASQQAPQMAAGHLFTAAAVVAPKIGLKGTLKVAPAPAPVPTSAAAPALAQPAAVLPAAVPAVVPTAVPAVLPAAVPAVLPAAVPAVVPTAVLAVLPAAVPAVLPVPPEAKKQSEPPKPAPPKDSPKAVTTTPVVDPVETVPGESSATRQDLEGGLEDSMDSHSAEDNTTNVAKPPRKRPAAKSFIKRQQLPRSTMGSLSPTTTTTTLPKKRGRAASKAKAKETVAKKAQVTKVKAVPGGAKPNNMVYEGTPDENLEGGWPEGWIKRTFKRMGGVTKGGTDRYWYTPKQVYKFRSMVEVKRFVKALTMTEGDEVEAKKIFKTMTL